MEDLLLQDREQRLLAGTHVGGTVEMRGDSVKEAAGRMAWSSENVGVADECGA